MIVGELVGRYTNDWIMNASIRHNKGVFEAESRLWCVKLVVTTLRLLTLRRACYIAVPLYICGFVTLGAAIQNHLNTGALIMGMSMAFVEFLTRSLIICTGWGIAELA